MRRARLDLLHQGFSTVRRFGDGCRSNFRDGGRRRLGGENLPAFRSRSSLLCCGRHLPEPWVDPHLVDAALSYCGEVTRFGK